MKQEVATEDMLLEASFDDVMAEMSGEKFWIRIFMRPCSPRPNSRQAHIKMENLKELIHSNRTDFSSEQLEKIDAAIADRENWYVSRFCSNDDQGGFFYR